MRGELFALLTLAITFVIGTIVVNTPLDGGNGVSLAAVAVPKIGPTASSTFYLLALAAAVATLLIAWGIQVSKFGAGLFAIHDDEDAAEVMGVPTYRYKLLALGHLVRAGRRGGRHPCAVPLVRDGGRGVHDHRAADGGADERARRHAALGRAGDRRGGDHRAALRFTAADHAVAGKALIGVILIAAILFMPDGILERVRRVWKRAPAAKPALPAAAAPLRIRRIGRRAGRRAAARAGPEQVLQAACGRSAAWTSTCGAARSSACSGPTARASRPSSTSSAAITRRPAARSAFEGRELERAAGAPHRAAAASRAPTRSRGPSRHLSVLRERGARDHVRRRGARPGARPTQQARTWLEFTGLQDKAHARPDDLNLHQRKFLELARALASRPRLVLLDEVLCGLTPSEIDDAVALIRRIRDQGSTIVFVEHVMRAVMALTDRIVVFNHGELLAEGAATDVMQRPDVMTAYLGRPPMLEVRDLQVAYGAAPALWGVSLDVRARRAAVRGRARTARARPR